VMLASRVTSPDERSALAFANSSVALLHGKVKEADRLTAEAYVQARLAGGTDLTLAQQMDLAFDQAWFHGDLQGAQRRLDEAVARTPLRSMPASLAPYRSAVASYAIAGRPDRARAIMAEFDARRHDSPTTRDSVFLHRMRGQIAIAAHDYATAQSELRITERVGCLVCDLPELGRAYDLGGVPDSAIAVYERYLTTKWPDRAEVDAVFLPAVHKRLGELYEARGEREKALAHYRAFIDLWKDADPEMQPKVTDAKQRVAGLVKGTDARKQ
jgi:eukaryotic-like serine/threonine-protein kinase